MEVTAVSPLAWEIACKAARLVFERRGNHSEAHISENELIGICAACAQTALNKSGEQ